MAWLAITSLENWRANQEHCVWGVRDYGSRDSASGIEQLKKAEVGDRFIIYVREHGLVGYVEVNSPMFHSDTRIFFDDLYPQRVKIRPILVQDVKHALPFRTLSTITNHATGNRLQNGASLYGKTLIPLSEADARVLIEQLSSEKIENQYRNVVPPTPSAILEGDLVYLLVPRLEDLEPGLKMLKREFAIDGGRIDLLCEDHEGNIVVVECKRSKAPRDVVGQIATYMGWILQHYAKERGVRGIIVVGKKDQQLEYAARAVPNLTVKEFSFSFV